MVLFNYPKSRQMFELLCIWADRFSNEIPFAFLIGWYVYLVVARWWDQLMSLPWSDKLAFKLISFCPGSVNFQIITHFGCFMIEKDLLGKTKFSRV